PERPRPRASRKKIAHAHPSASPLSRIKPRSVLLQRRIGGGACARRPAVQARGALLGEDATVRSSGLLAQRPCTRYAGSAVPFRSAHPAHACARGLAAWLDPPVEARQPCDGARTMPPGDRFAAANVGATRVSVC